MAFACTHDIPPVDIAVEIASGGQKEDVDGRLVRLFLHERLVCGILVERSTPSMLTDWQWQLCRKNRLRAPS